MIHIVSSDSDNGSVTEADLRAISAEAAAGTVQFWIDVEAPTEAELDEIRRSLAISSEALNDCIEGDQRPRLDEFDEGNLILAYGAIAEHGRLEFEPRKIGMFADGKILLTIHQQPLASVTTLRERYAKSGTPPMRSVDHALYQLLDAMVDYQLEVAEHFETRLEELEDASLDAESGEQILEESADLRPGLLELRRLAFAHREVVVLLIRQAAEAQNDRLESQFTHVRDHLTLVVETTDACRERLHGVRDNYHTVLATRTNEIMKRLTLMATVLLPLTLIAGIYGMNLPLWPPSDADWSFWAVLGVMSGAAVALYALFRRNHWV